MDGDGRRGENPTGPEAILGRMEAASRQATEGVIERGWTTG